MSVSDAPLTEPSQVTSQVRLSSDIATTFRGVVGSGDFEEDVLVHDSDLPLTEGKTVRYSRGEYAFCHAGEVLEVDDDFVRISLRGDPSAVGDEPSNEEASGLIDTSIGKTANAEMNKVLGLSFGIFFVGSVMDHLTTEFGLKQAAGISEANPYLVFLFDYLSVRDALIVSKAFALAFILLCGAGIYLLHVKLDGRTTAEQKQLPRFMSKLMVCMLLMLAGVIYIHAAMNNLELIINSILNQANGGI